MGPEPRCSPNHLSPKLGFKLNVRHMAPNAQSKGMKKVAMLVSGSGTDSWLEDLMFGPYQYQGRQGQKVSASLGINSWFSTFSCVPGPAPLNAKSLIQVCS